MEASEDLTSGFKSTFLIKMQLVDGVFISMFVLMFVFLVRCKRNLVVYGAKGFGSCIIYLDDCDSWEHVP